MSVSLNDLPNKVFSSGDTVTVTTGSGIEGPQGPTGATGTGGTVAYFGNFFSTETQNNAGATVASTFTLNSTVDANGISIVDSTKITFAAGSDGTYDLQFSVQFDKTDSGTDEVDVWLSKNGNYEVWSNTVLSLVGNNAKVVAAWNFQLNDVVGGDYFQLHWWSPDTSMRALAAAAGSNPTRPAVPSIIVTVAQVTYTQAGAPGAAATVAVGSTTTGAAGTSASVVNSGTSSAAVLDFTIPRGDTGATGATGPEGGTSTLTTKGDLLTRDSSAVARLPVGATTGHVLTVDPAEATGMKWAAASGGAVSRGIVASTNTNAGHLPGVGITTYSANLTLITNGTIVSPIVLDEAFSVSGFAAWVDFAGSGTLNFAVYNASRTWAGTTKAIAPTTGVSNSTTGSKIENITPVTLQPGRYLLAMGCTTGGAPRVAIYLGSFWGTVAFPSGNNSSPRSGFVSGVAFPDNIGTTGWPIPSDYAGMSGQIYPALLRGSFV